MYTQDTPLAISNPATAKQIDFIRVLVDQKYPAAERAQYLDFLNNAVISKVRASEIITMLKAMPMLFNSEHGSDEGANTEELDLGMYQVDGVIYKVQRAVHGSGFLYAKRWDEEAQGFEKETGAIRKIRASHRMTLEEAARFGQITNICGHCGRTLTDEDSIAAGIGPVCAGKYN